MILLIDTSTPECQLTLVDKTGERTTHAWEAGRELASGMLRFMEEKLVEESLTLQDLSGLGVFAGPGSFTGLRIGMTVLNVLAADLKIPIVTSKGDDWQNDALNRLYNGEDDTLALPFYGRDANITTPKK